MKSINCKGKVITFDVPRVMGIINITPDSFYEGSRAQRDDTVLQTAEQMLKEGATFLDIGGQSTRPGSSRVGEDEELNRVLPAIETIMRHFPGACVSIDTFYARVARLAIDAGASLVNDISAGTIDTDLLATVAELRVPYVLMHMKGDPQTMQRAPAYEDVTVEVFDFLSFTADRLVRLGIMDIIIDPGFGFGKTAEHNFQLLAGLPYLLQLEKPLMIGLSRKGMVYKTIRTDAAHALNGTTVLHTAALLKGASLLRVHDVKQAMEAVALTEEIKRFAQ